MRHEDGSVVTRTNSETTPGFRAITMFFKSEQANVSDARDAVKKQLLRSLIQQVVDEINSHTLDGFSEIVRSFMDENDLAGISSELKSSITKEIQSQLFPSVMDEIMQEVSPDAPAIETMVKEKLEEIDMSGLRSVLMVGFKHKIQEDILPEIINDVASTATNTETPEMEAIVRAGVDGIETQSMIDTLRVRIESTFRKSVLPDLVDEIARGINGPDSNDLEALVLAGVKKVETQSLEDTLRSEIETTFRSIVVPSLVDDISKDVIAEDQVDIDSLIKAKMDDLDLSDFADRIAETAQNHLTLTLLPELVNTIATEVNEVPVQEYEKRIRDLVSSADYESLLQRLSEKATELFTERTLSEITDALNTPEAALEQNIQEMVNTRLEEFLLSSEWADGLREAEEQIRSRVQKAVEETAASDDEMLSIVNERVSDSITSNDELRARLEASATESLVTRLADTMAADLASSNDLISATAADLEQRRDLMDQIIEQVRERVHGQIASESIEAVSNIEQTSDRAFELIDPENEILVGNRDAVQNKLIEDIADRATRSLADLEEVRERAGVWITEDHPAVREAVAEVEQYIHALVREVAARQAEDTQAVVGNVLPSFTKDTEAIRAAVKETRTKLIDRVVSFTLRDMEDASQVAADANKRIADENERILDAVRGTLAKLTERVSEHALERLSASDKVAKDASSRVPTQNDVFQRAIKATMSLLIDDIVIEAGSRMKSAEKVSSDARARMDAIPAEVRQASGVLENMLLTEVADMTKERLYDVQYASEKASTFLRATKELDAIEEAVRMKLFKGVADQVVKSIEDPEKAGAEAFWQVDQQHEHILDAIGELRNQLLFTIARESMSQLGDQEKVAQESRTYIPDTSKQITGATTRLYEIVVEDIARQSLNLLRDADAVVEGAASHVDDQHEVVQRMRGIVQRHLMESLLANALNDIGQNVAGTDEAGERAFFKQAIRDIQSTRTQPSNEDPNQLDSQPFEGPTVTTEDTESSETWSKLSDIDPSTPGGTPSSDESLLTESVSADPSQTEVSTDSGARKSWTVNEFRPTDRDPLSGAVSGDGARTRAPKFPKPGINTTTLYVYGVISTEAADSESFYGIEGIHADSEVKLLACGSLTALVSPIGNQKFSPKVIRESMKDTDWLKSHVRRHADVLAEAQAVQTVIPMRFGCVFSNPREIMQFIDSRKDALQEALVRLHNRSEFSVSVRIDGSSVNTVPNDLEGVPSGVADFLRAAAGEKPAAAELEATATKIHAHLARYAGESMRNPNTEAEMLLNATHLVTIASEEEFKHAVKTLSAEYDAQGIRIEVSGPWPPYHFVDIDFDGDAGREKIPV